MKHKLYFLLLLCIALLFPALVAAADSVGSADPPESVVEEGPAPEAAAQAASLRLPIVMYHQISENGLPKSDYVLSSAQFENDLKYLRDAGYESVSVQQLLDWADGVGTLPEKPCMITFDDGYETTDVLAVPLLEKYGFTGVVAVIGSIAQQYSDLPDHNLRYSHLSWERVAELSQGETLEVQYHSWGMHELTPRKGCNKRRGEDSASYRAALEADAAQFFAASETHGVRLVPSLAYPFGAYCAESGEIMRDLGFRIAFTCTERVNQLTGDVQELMELGRYNRAPGKNSADFFAAWDSLR